MQSLRPNKTKIYIVDSQENLLLLLLLLFIVKNADCKYKINGIAIYTLKTKRNHQKKTGFANITCNDKHILKRKCLNLCKAIICHAHENLKNLSG